MVVPILGILFQNSKAMGPWARRWTAESLSFDKFRKVVTPLPSATACFPIGSSVHQRSVAGPDIDSFSIVTPADDPRACCRWSVHILDDNVEYEMPASPIGSGIFQDPKDERTWSEWPEGSDGSRYLEGVAFQS